MADPINPKHYKLHPSGVECIEITEHLGFCIGNAIKYLWRADYKGGLEDLEKARWYLDREIAKRTAEEDEVAVSAPSLPAHIEALAERDELAEAE